MYYHECPHCGCYLDPGERCDCYENRNRYLEAIQKCTREEKDGQLAMIGTERYVKE